MQYLPEKLKQQEIEERKRATEEARLKREAAQRERAAELLQRRASNEQILQQETAKRPSRLYFFLPCVKILMRGFCLMTNMPHSGPQTGRRDCDCAVRLHGQRPQACAVLFCRRAHCLDAL